MTHLAGNVRRIREGHGWSQEMLAEMMKANVRTIQRLERGEPVSEETLRDVATVFKIDRAILDLDPQVVKADMERAAAWLKENYREVTLRLIENGHQLGVLMDCHAFLHNCALEDSTVLDESAKLQGYLHDLEMIWEVATPTSRREFEKELDAQLARFSELGAAVYATVDPRNVVGRHDAPGLPPMRCRVLVTHIVKKTGAPFHAVLVPRRQEIG